jgi:hypothetical protein
VLEAANMHVEDIWAVLDNQTFRAARRPVILASLHGSREVTQNGWCMLVAETDSQDNAFVLIDTMLQLGWDMGMVGFPKGRTAMVINICTAEMVLESGADFGGWMRSLAPEIGASEAWGSRSAGRIIAPLPLNELFAKCSTTILNSLPSRT